MSGMASLVEFQDYANLVCSKLTEQLDTSTLGVNIEEIWRNFDTPPLSPDHASSCGSVVDQEESNLCDDSDSQSERLLLDELIACQQLLARDDDWLSCDSQQSSGSQSIEILPELLIQDCMWNCEKYEPRNQLSSPCTPVPSPPPSPPLDDTELEEPSTTKPDYISPSAVFPALVPKKESPEENLKTEKQKEKIKMERKDVATVSNVRVHPQAHASESDEEIDVVTVMERPKMSTRKRLISLSAPCSRQSSPIPSPAKRRKCHAKRLRRLHSAGAPSIDNPESDDEQKRESHNILERKRRNDLKYSFHLLRGQVPDLEDNQRAPKVTILRKAADFIRQLQEEDRRLKDELQRELTREERLLERLAYLKNLPPV